MTKPTEIRAPRMDDRPLLDVMLALYGYPAVLVANKLKLFDLLAEKPLTLQEVCIEKGWLAVRRRLCSQYSRKTT